MAEEVYRTEIPELNIGRTLKRLRESAGYTMETFGGMMGWSKSTVSKVESENRGISAEDLYRAATILGVPISNFYPEVITEDWEDDQPSVSSYADEIRAMACALIESKGKVTPDIEEQAKSVFLRSIPQTIYRLLNVSPNEVSIKGTLMRGPHFLPRIEIHYTGRKGYELDWFYIVLSFRDGLKHIFLSLVQDPDVRFRADCEPLDQADQLDAIREHCEDVVFHKLPNWEADWPGAREAFGVFLDENGMPPEAGTIRSYGYVPVCPPEAYDVTVNDTVYPDMQPFVTVNFDGRGAITGDGTPEQVIDTLHNHQELFDEEYALMDSLDEDLKHVFKHLGYLIEDVETNCFVRWKKEVLSGSAGKRGPDGRREVPGESFPIMRVKPYSLAQKVMEAHDFKCEVDPAHETFADRQTGKPYAEVSFLIPMSAQSNFKKDLNCEANMICVCPMCNRKLVRGAGSMIEDMIVPLYYSRREALKKAGIDITLKQLLDFYEA